ncbi:hypothetical protein HU720_01945 [Pseudomonas sp. SWRI51]|uniref:hypothetical protein n=1 Tax=Pseudomonas sp. SWRI51 TaxID=2745491 RepID=UPI00164444A3|nr:hypothetical protein [Pseudomonas sp. SWRI51]MBC3410066.1 hypothetical protein [Pseudomonas sp. SWRI51]
MSIHIALPGKAQAQLETALVRYRKAIADLDAAIKSQAWGRIHALQGSRDLQAHTIAMLVNANSPVVIGEGVPA